MKQLTVKIAQLPDDWEPIRTIRAAVFQQEQGIDETLEFDGKDEEAVQFLAYLNDRPVGTARIRFVNQSMAKIERLAVLADARKQGVGQQIMNAAIEFLSKKDIPEIRIHAQEAVKEFYQALGFEVEGDRFQEAGIPHLKMSKRLGLTSGRNETRLD
ncbi:GNAT family N-acetyltransferase [Phormidesmis priestleyi]|uniref:GNAT family N-acetyltransferase n=1 Tax=Phormidesmis priestleyi TaxID=268141 RepID=UPI00083AF839|nr:GNAT family N-acetyltransferase [Phormidesmis priestleyi]